MRTKTKKMLAAVDAAHDWETGPVHGGGGTAYFRMDECRLCGLKTGGFARLGRRILRIGAQTKLMIGGPHRHTDLGPIAECSLIPLSAASMSEAEREMRKTGIVPLGD